MATNSDSFIGSDHLRPESIEFYPKSKPTVSGAAKFHLFMYTLTTLYSGTAWLICSSIVESISVYYGGLSTLEANSLIFLWGITNFILYPLAAWTTDSPKAGQRWAMIVGSGTLALGLIWRYAFGMSQKTGFPMFFTGTVIASFSQPFLTAGPVKLSSNWFPPEYRSVATAIGSLAQLMGAIFGFIVPPLMVSDPTTKGNLTESSIKGFQTLNLGAMIIGIAIFIMNLVFFRNNPQDKKPSLKSHNIEESTSLLPTSSSDSSGNIPTFVISDYTFPFKSSVELLLGETLIGGLAPRAISSSTKYTDTTLTWEQRKTVFISVFVFAFSEAIIASLGSLLVQFLVPFGFSQELSGVLAGISVLLGIILSIYFGYLLDSKYQPEQYHILLRICSTALTVTLGIILIFLVISQEQLTKIDPSDISGSLPIGLTIILAILFIFAAAFGTGQYPVIFELVAETAFPAGEGTLTALLMSTLQIVNSGLVFLWVFGLAADIKMGAVHTLNIKAMHTVIVNLGIWFGIACLCTIASYFVKPVGARKKFEEELSLFASSVSNID